MQFNAYFLLDEASLDPDIIEDNAPKGAGCNDDVLDELEAGEPLDRFAPMTASKTFDHLCATVEATLDMFFRERMYDQDDELIGPIDAVYVTAIASRRFNRTRVDDNDKRTVAENEGWFELFEAASAECPWLKNSSVKALSEMKPKAISRELKRLSKEAVKDGKINMGAVLLDLIHEVRETGLAGFMETDSMRDFLDENRAFDIREFLEVTDPPRKGLSEDAVIVRAHFHL